MASKENIPDLSSASKYSVYVAPASRFAGEFATIVEGLSFTKFIERAAIMFADDVARQRDRRGWNHYWEQADGSPSVALVLLYADKTLPFDEVRQNISDFLYAHEPFFFERDGRHLKPKRRFIEVLWPHVASGYLPDHWQKSKASDAWRTAEKMADMLTKSRLKPPAWGPGKE